MSADFEKPKVSTMYILKEKPERKKKGKKKERAWIYFFTGPKVRPLKVNIKQTNESL